MPYALFKDGVQVTARYKTQQELIENIVKYHPDKYINSNGAFALREGHKIREIRLEQINEAKEKIEAALQAAKEKTTDEI